MQVSIRRIPNYITARSQQGLRRLMLLKNTKEGKEFHYFDIQRVGSEWVAWFYADLSRVPILKKRDN